MMQQPSISINSCDVPGPHYKMWKTASPAEGITPIEVVHTIVAANSAALISKKSPLRNIILNCHGESGKLWMGGSNSEKGCIDKSNVGVFGALKSLNVGTIWLVACKAARGAEGQNFCQALASVAGTQVIASDESQEVGVWDTYRYYVGLSGQIDDYEGTVYSFTPVGGMSRGIDPEEAVWTVLV